MSKVFNVFEKASIKNSAKAVAHYQSKNDKIDEKIASLLAEKEMNAVYIEQYSKPIYDLTGYSPLDLCEKVNRGAQNDWVFKYPETIVPVEEEKEVEEVTQTQELTEEQKEEINQDFEDYKEEMSDSEYQEYESDFKEDEDPIDDLF